MHNKKQNSGLIFELLTRKVVENVTEHNDKNIKSAITIMKKYFSKGTAINEELRLFNTLLYTEVSKWQLASKLLNEVLKESTKINSKRLQNEKYHLLQDIYKTFDKTTFFEAKIPNYRIYASIYQLIENHREKNKLDIGQKIKLEEGVIYHLLDNTELRRINQFRDFMLENKDEKEEYDTLVYNLVIRKFNNAYNGILSEGQKEIIKEYIDRTSEKEFDQFAQKKVKDMETEMYYGMKTVNDKPTLEKLFEAMKRITNVLSIKDKDEKTECLMSYQEIIDELKNLKENRSENN